MNLDNVWIPKVLGLFGRAGSGKNTIAVKVGHVIPGTREYAFAAPLKEFVEAIFGISKDRLYGPSELRNARLEQWSPDERHAIRARFWNLGKQFSYEWIAAIVDTGAEFGLLSRGKATHELIKWFDGVMDRSKRGDVLTARVLLQELGTDVGRAHYHTDLWAALAVRRIYRDSQVERFPLAVITDGRFENEALLIRKLIRGKVLRVTRPVAESSQDAHPSEHGLPDLSQCDARISNAGTLEQLDNEVRETLDGFGWI